MTSEKQFKVDGSPVVPHPPLGRYYSSEGERRDFVDRIFDSTAPHYDWINSLLSFGTGIRYRRDALQRAGIQAGMRVLDVCTGSGQVARAAIELVGTQGLVVGLDGSLGMVAEARKEVSIPLAQSYVEYLPIAAQQFDAVTMGYALRHVADLRLVFQEYLRVLKPGGSLLILEFTKPRSKWMYHAARIYLRQVVPAVARLKGRDARTLMEYFWDTIENCVPPEIILQALGEAGFSVPARFGQIDLFSEYTASRPQG